MTIAADITNPIHKQRREYNKLLSILKDPRKRLSTLYWQVDKQGNPFRFTPNAVQQQLYDDMWYKNVILKARQEGVTTLVQLFLLDRCLFTSNISAGIIAHNQADAQNFFEKKLKYAYDHLPQPLRDARPLVTDSKSELRFSNGSSIRVGVSLRSDTLQYLHVSEFGKICAIYPKRASEIISGALNTLSSDGFVFVESTAEGAYGAFYDMCDRAEKKKHAGTALTKMDYRFHFFAWWQQKEYALELDEPVEPDKETQAYFEELESEHGIYLTQAQKNWYIKKSEEQGDKMFREFPSTSSDAWKAVVEGAVFGKQMKRARKERRIRNFPIVESIPVNTFWDLGRNDYMAIWFHQRVGPENRFINYIEGQGESLQWYIKQLQQMPYIYGTHYMPHDVEVTDLTNEENKTRLQVAEDAGLKNIETVIRINDKEEAHHLCRQALESCFFHAENCNDGIIHLENYRYAINEKTGGYSTNPVDNVHKHGSDALMQFAQAYSPNHGTRQSRGHVGMY